MIVAIASGKGGTGKTSVSASLATVWNRPVLAVDLDVEEPNLHLFLRPKAVRSQETVLEVPVLDQERCTHCGACADLCQFKALSSMGKHLMVFADLCHGCGGCFRVCPTGALQRGSRVLGAVESGCTSDGIPTLGGRLRVGEAMSPPLMKHVLRAAHRVKGDADLIIDAPPGVSCPAMTAVRDADVILLVTEPTPFGLNDLRLAVQAFRPLEKPLGVVLNRAGIGDDRVQAFCAEQGIPILAEIPFRRDIAEHYARGGVLARLDPGLGERFELLASRVGALAKEAAHA